MSRIRTVKPELFRHEALFDAELESGLPLRLAFIGLFTVADCEGRFLWKPRTLKLDVLPHDTVDFSAVLNALQAAGFIEQYEVDGKRYGLIPSFKKHQQIPTREQERGSVLPGKPGFDSVQVEARTEHVPVQVEARTEHCQELQEGEGEREWKGNRKETPQEERAATTLADARARALGGGRKVPKAGNPIAADWFPGDAAYDILVGLGIPRPFAESCIPEFRLYWTERGDARPGWDASFVNSVKRSWDKRPRDTKVMGQRRPGQTIAERITEEHEIIFGPTNEPDPFSFLPKPKPQPEPRLIEGEVLRGRH